MINKVFFAVTVIILSIAACGGEEEEAERETLEPSPLPVAASAAVVDTLFEVVSSTGRIASARTQSLSAQIQGEVVLAPEYVGMEVSDGEVVFRIASGESASRLSSASSSYRNAQSLYEFECENYRGELTPEVKSMLRQTTGLADAQTSLASAQTQYSNAAITAGFDGVISDVSAREGMVVYPGTVLGEIIDPWSLQATVNLDERELARCAGGQRVYVTVPSLNDTTLVGTVASVSPVINPSMRAGEVIIDLPAVPNLRTGATARLEIVIAVYPDQLVIPQEAILIRDDRDMVFVVLDGHADWRYVTLGPEGRGIVAVEEGVETGEQVITSGHYSLAHDAPVAVVN
ncbi:MAG: efflux RND transporter periplasmic adaptor subunit [Candidatus Aegiribacteria sp.]|nr:efflux RND transporter periplasmic adaptor subunit [Candidatus Aegiribacteria sp.]